MHSGKRWVGAARGCPPSPTFAAIGIPEAQAETHARLALGAARGLLLDLLVSGEREQVAQAADLLNRLLLLSAEVGGAGGSVHG